MCPDKNSLYIFNTAKRGYFCNVCRTVRTPADPEALIKICLHCGAKLTKIYSSEIPEAIKTRIGYSSWRG